MCLGERKTCDWENVCVEYFSHWTDLLLIDGKGVVGAATGSAYIEMDKTKVKLRVA